MNILSTLRDRLTAALQGLVADPVQLSALAEMVRPSQDPKFGDYQANCAMPLGKQLGRSPREVATDIVSRLDVGDLCHPPEIAGPGFINLRLKDEWLVDRLAAAMTDERLGVEPASPARTYVIDYSAPNVAKPMHVGHIRSTVIGDSLYRTLKFCGHRVIGDNHLGDWGTQFGMILYGYRHFCDQEAYRQDPVHELARLYRVVNQLVEALETREQLPKLRAQLAGDQAALGQLTAAGSQGDKEQKKKAEKALRRAETKLEELTEEIAAREQKLAVVESSPELSRLLASHPDIARAVLAETAKLHADDPENLRLWKEFMPFCRKALDEVYDRLGVTFDVTLGESFYHDRLAGVVADLKAKGLARESEGALCIFLDGDDPPMIVQKKDGAYLYSTTDLATIQYRMETWSPDAMLYVVDHRQSLHFQQLFAAARRWGYTNMELQHLAFGTVLGKDGRPYKTRAGDTVGLMGLLDEAVTRAGKIVSENDDAKPDGQELSADERRRIAEIVGIGALKYADLAQNRTSDYEFSYDKMLAMTGNTATYMQYAYARVRSIFRRGRADAAQLRQAGAPIELETPAERALAIDLLRFSEALDSVLVDYRPNQLTTYLFELANRYASFFEQCPVLKAERPALRDSRLRLCDLTARTLEKGLSLLGIQVIEQM